MASRIIFNIIPVYWCLYIYYNGCNERRITFLSDVRNCSSKDVGQESKVKRRVTFCRSPGIEV